MKKSKKRTKNTIVVALVSIVLISVISGYILLSEASPLVPRYSLSVTVRDAYGAVEGATVNIENIGTYTTDSAGSIESVQVVEGTYLITVMAPEHGTKTESIEVASDMNLIIEMDYIHQYLTIISPIDGTSIGSSDAECDPAPWSEADIIIWIKGTYSPGRSIDGNWIKTFIDDDSRATYTLASSVWDARAYVGHISSGLHTLYVQLTTHDSSSSTVIEQQSVDIYIPNEWHISFSTVGLADEGDGISRNPSDFPYWLGMNPPFPGEVTRISGRFYLDTLGNDPWHVWVDLWNPSTNNWVIVKKILNTQSGWNNVDISVDYVNTDWWGFAGSAYTNGVVYNRVTEFEGEIWMSAGTHYYNTASINIFDWFNDQFFPGEGKNTAGPQPSVIDDGGVLMSIEASDLYAYGGSTAIAWFICIVISLVVLAGVAFFLKKRR